jgi:hypothetical protein
MKARGHEVSAALGELAAERPLACRVRGASMRPLLDDGERVELSPPRFYWPGDVVALVSPGGHRLVHRLLGFYWWGRWLAVTQGDAAPAPDSPVPLSSLLGRVRAAEGREQGLDRVPARMRLRACRLYGSFLAARAGGRLSS